MLNNRSKRPALDSLKSQNSEEESQPSLNLEEQIIEREKIENTPFTLITTNEKSFIAFGRYRVSQYKSTKEEALGDLTNQFWEILLNMMILVLDYSKEKGDSE